MAVLYPRHHYMIRLVEAIFNLKELYPTAESLFNVHEILTKLDSFLGGNGPRFIFFTFVPRDDPYINLLEPISKENDWALSGSFSCGYLICAFDNKPLWDEKWLYFDKQNERSCIDVNISLDSKLLFGTHTNSGICYPIILRNLQLPINTQVTCGDKNVWNIEESLDNLDDILNSILFFPKGYDFVLCDCKDISKSTFSSITLYAKLLTRWCTQINTFIKANEERRMLGAFWGLEKEAGHWKSRYTALDALHQQIHCKPRLNVILSIKRAVQEPHGLKLQSLANAWEIVETHLCKERIEACLISRLMEALDKHCFESSEIDLGKTESYLSDTIQLFEDLSLKNKTIYSSKDSIHCLFLRLSNTIAASYRKSAEQFCENSSFWEVTNEKISALKKVGHINTLYKKSVLTFRDISLSNYQNGFVFSVYEIEKAFHLNYLEDNAGLLVCLIHMSGQIRAFKDCQIPGFNQFVNEFEENFDHFQLSYPKPHTSNDHDLHKDTTAMIIKSKHMQEKMINHFSIVVNSRYPLDILANRMIRVFSKMDENCQEPSEFQHKIMDIIARRIAKEMHKIQSLYERFKDDLFESMRGSEIQRRLQWSLTLKRHIDVFYYLLQVESKPLRVVLDNYAIPSKHKKLSWAINTFEKLIYSKWKSRYTVTLASFKSTLLFMDKLTGKLHVNFDKNILSLANEAHQIMQNGIKMDLKSSSIEAISSKNLSFKLSIEYLRQVIKLYENMKENIDPMLISSIYRRRFIDIEKNIKNAMTTLTWESIQIVSFSKQLYEMTSQLDRDIHTCGTILDDINGVIKKIKRYQCPVICKHFTRLDDFKDEWHKAVQLSRYFFMESSMYIQSTLDKMLVIVSQSNQKFDEENNKRRLFTQITSSDTERDENASPTYVISKYNSLTLDSICTSLQTTLQTISLKFTHEQNILQNDRSDERDNQSYWFSLRLLLSPGTMRVHPSFSDIERAMRDFLVHWSKCYDYVDTSNPNKILMGSDKIKYNKYSYEGDNKNRKTTYSSFEKKLSNDLVQAHNAVQRFTKRAKLILQKYVHRILVEKSWIYFSGEFLCDSDNCTNRAVFESSIQDKQFLEATTSNTNCSIPHSTKATKRPFNVNKEDQNLDSLSPIINSISIGPVFIETEFLNVQLIELEESYREEKYNDNST